MSSNTPPPDNVPDMSLEGISEKPMPAAAPKAETSYASNPDVAKPKPDLPATVPDESEWHVGNRVFAPWEPVFLYPGVIRQIMEDEAKGDQALIRYDDGGEGWVFLYSLCPIEYHEGQQVQVRRHGGQYSPGKIESIDDKEIRVRFDDGSTEWVEASAMRIPCVANGPGALGTQLAPWQTPPPEQAQGGGIPSWAITIGLIVLVALLRFGCRAMMQN